MLLAVPVVNAFAITYQTIPLSVNTLVDHFVYTATRSQGVIFYLMDARDGAVPNPIWKVVAQNATDNTELGRLTISTSGTFTHLFGNMIPAVGFSNPGFYIFDGRVIYQYEWNGTTIKEVSNDQVCSSSPNALVGSHHIQSPSHFTTANLTIDNIITGTCVADKALWVVNGNSMTTMATTPITANCQWLVDGYINLGLLADQTITALCNNGGTINSQTGPQEYVVYSYETNGPTILNGGHIVSQILLRSITISATPTYSLVQNMDYSHFSFLDVSNLFNAKPLTMQDTCPSGDCPTIFNVWQNFETGSSSTFFKNGIIVNYDKALKGIRVYNTGNSTQLGSRTCGTDCFPVSFAGEPWLSLDGENPNLVYEGTYNTITLWNTTTETSAYYNMTPSGNPPGGSGNNCTTGPQFSYRLAYDTSIGATTTGGQMGNNATNGDTIVAGQQILPSSSMVGQKIHTVTFYVPLQIFTNITSGHNIQFGVFSATNATVIRSFATLDLANTTMFSAGTNVFNITLPVNNPYTITGGEIIGYGALSPSNGSMYNLEWKDNFPKLVSDSFIVSFPPNGSPPPVWEYTNSPTTDYALKIYTQTLLPCNPVPTPTNPGSVFCANPANANILQCRVAGNTTTLNVAPGIQNLISSTGIFNLCSGVFKTNGMGYLVTLILVIIGVGLLWVASNKRGRDIPTFLWVIFAIGIFGFSTAIGCIDPTILIVTIIAIIALGVASTTQLFQGGFGRIREMGAS